MIDLSTYPDEIMLARGQYSTVRHAHEAKKLELRAVLQDLMTNINIVLHAGTSNDPDQAEIDSAKSLARALFDAVDAVSNETVTLAQQKKDLRPIAYPS